VHRRAPKELGGVRPKFLLGCDTQVQQTRQRKIYRLDRLDADGLDSPTELFDFG